MRNPCTCQEHVGIELTEDNVSCLLRRRGIRFFNTRCGCGITLLHKAIFQRQLGAAKILFERAKSENVTLCMRWGEFDILNWALCHSSQESVVFILEKLLGKCTTIEETAKTLEWNFGMLVDRFPRLVEEYLENDEFFMELAQFQVPAFVFDQSDEKPVATTTANLAEVENRSVDELKAFWRENLPHWTAEEDEMAAEHVTAVLKVVCIRNAASVGEGSILAKLLAGQVTVNVFKSSLVKLIVQRQWHNRWRWICKLSAGISLIAALSFSVAVATSVEDESIHLGWFFVVYAIAIPWLISALASPSVRYLSLMILVTVLMPYCRENVSGLAAFVVSLECIVCWTSFLWYAQPLSSTGPLVSMIRYVFWDILSFVMMGVFVVAGFGLAFLVLFGKELVDDDGRNFSSPLQCFESLFYAVLGEFDPDDFRMSDGWLSVWRRFLFDAFLFLGPIVLLSLLISILGDTYDKVRLRQEAELFKCRVQIVSQCADKGRMLLFLRRRLKTSNKRFPVTCSTLHTLLVTPVIDGVIGLFNGWVIGWTGYIVSGLVGLPRWCIIFFLFGFYGFWFGFLRNNERRVEDKAFLLQLVAADQTKKADHAAWQGKLIELERMITTLAHNQQDHAARDKSEMLSKMSQLEENLTQISTQVAALQNMNVERQ